MWFWVCLCCATYTHIDIYIYVWWGQWSGKLSLFIANACMVCGFLGQPELAHCSLNLCWCTFPHTLVKGNKVWFFMVAHVLHIKIQVFFAHGCLRKMICLHACVNEIFRFHACVSHEISIFACFGFACVFWNATPGKKNVASCHDKSEQTHHNCRQWKTFVWSHEYWEQGPCTTPDHRLKAKMQTQTPQSRSMGHWRKQSMHKQKKPAYIGTTHARTQAHVLNICTTTPQKRKDLAPPKMQGSGQKRKDFDPKNARKKCKEKTQGSKKTRIGRSG